MFISKISVEDWKGNQNRGLLKPVRTWTEIEASIKALDGQRKTLVTLEADDESHLAVGGGPSKYLVYLTFDNELFHYLVDPSKSDKEESLVVGGQKGVYPAKLCVGMDSALKAAKTFAEFGKMSQSTTWERDGIAESVF
jgi:Immunity protein Imm1